uniref:Uncharacterized protein n=1 Tax=Knipowitschia caucasica TaxID=637954 RepID=A0AAV2LWF1_KNICA
MSEGGWIVCVVLAVLMAAAAAEDVAVRPRDCSLECLRRGAPECEYCRISQSDVQKALGSKAVKTLGSCIPWPCFELMGNGDPDICQHYVRSPNNVTVEKVEDPDPSSDSVLVSWRPSVYGRRLSQRSGLYI